MKQTITALAGMAALLAAGAASAQAVDEAPAAAQRGLYGSLGVGIATVSDLDVTYRVTSGATTSTLGFRFDVDNAAAFVGAIGYDFGRVRADVELATSKNDVSTVTLESLNGQPVTLTAADRAVICNALDSGGCGGSGNAFEVDDARVEQEIALLNLWVDLPVGGAVTPYVGGGAGIARYSLNEEEKGRFVWQAGGGVAVALTRSLSLTGDARHRQLSGVTLSDGGESIRVGKVKTNLFTAGLRLRF